MRNILMLLPLLASLCLAQMAHADNNDIYSPGMSASVDLGRYHTDFAYADGDHQADISRYGITLVQPVATDVGFGLQGGYMTAGINDNTLYPLGDGYGPFLGLFFAWHPMLGDYWSADFHAGYTWHDMSFQGQNQKADVTWYTGYASLGPVLRLGPWRLAAGGYYQYVNGTETDTGTVNQRLDFSATHSTGAYIGVAYYLDRTGSLGIYAFGGARRGVSLVFKREF
ncbi:MAG: hypothetical protein ACRESO_08385 [Gammaproteobacteria bacterium]